MSLERIRTIIVDDHDDLGRLVARRIAEVIREPAAAGGARRARTRHRLHADRRLPRADPHAPGRGAQLRATSSRSTSTSTTRWTPDSIHSYHRFMWENLFAHIDIQPRERAHPARRRAARARSRTSAGGTRTRSARAGGIDFQILGIGKTGHIGFNEPGSGAESRTRLVTLDPVTRQDAAADFFGEEYVPREAITMGVATILEAREIAILATGEHKAAIVQRAVEGEIDLEVAATFLQRHPNTTFYLDRAGRRRRSRAIATPWLLDEVEWTPELDGARGRLALAADRQGDPQAHAARLRRAPAVVARGAVRLAGRGERRGLQRARRQDPRQARKLPRGQRDRSASRRIRTTTSSRWAASSASCVENENEITVAYMTSGNIAVFDHDVRRYVDFLERLAAERRHRRRRRASALGRRGARVPRRQAAGRRRHPRGAGHQAHHPRERRRWRASRRSA